MKYALKDPGKVESKPQLYLNSKLRHIILKDLNFAEAGKTNYILLIII